MQRRTLTLAAFACALTLPATASAAERYELIVIGDETQNLQARAVGEHGEVVGVYTPPGPFHARGYVWRDGVRQDLPNLPGWNGGLPVDIDDSGVIVTVRVPISRAGRRAIQRAPLPATARLVGTTGTQTVRAARAFTLVAPPGRTG